MLRRSLSDRPVNLPRRSGIAESRATAGGNGGHPFGPLPSGGVRPGRRGRRARAHTGPGAPVPIRTSPLISGPNAWDHSLTALWRFTDLDRTPRTSLRNGVPAHRPAVDGSADLTLVLTEPQLMGPPTGHGLDRIDHTGDPTVLTTLMSVLSEPDPGFAVVTP
ncbi:alkyl sulfatase C-terminal domain-containing protein [Kitasatospora griseola]|uniref:alkyl sulfatase C-terminal domain-containing protein n=1 Tax=Kitasatospora griseola TaxID=2064 RepID=UPI00198879EC|nr:alkyl sulfatase C-terminal domain-containing protein [Kitasatospora griseola]GGQ91410.1 hypothetical protein GCM10010195_54180 [Kitasatospora griseola]